MSFYYLCNPFILFRKFNNFVFLKLYLIYFKNYSKLFISCKFDLIFDNAYTGTSKYYPPLENNLYYTNALSNAVQQCDTTSDNVSWEGYPQYNEFDFIRDDNSDIRLIVV